MRDIKTFLRDMITKPPVLFPLVALFHIVLFFWTAVSLAQQPGTATQISTLWMLGFTVFWVATADMRKWGAIGYILLTAADILVWYTTKDPAHKDLYSSSIFLTDIALSFFILFYFKRYR